MRAQLFTAFAASALMACSGESSLTGSDQTPAVPAPPATLTSVRIGDRTAQIWSYVSDNLQTAQDPINVIFTGRAQPEEIRNLLLGLDGNRTAAFPDVFPFNCTWSDAIGGLMEGYAAESGWTGGAVQLQCGTYGPLRFHLRLFRMGDFTAGNVHFEMVIPGTADHQVLSWELAEQLVTFDMARSGLLGDAPGTTGPINGSPSYRQIPSVIYNLMPVELRATIAGPLGNVDSDVGIATDGQATTFNIAGSAAPAPATTEQEFVINYGQVIPKPFCAQGPADYVWVEGPVTLRQTVTVSGGLQQHFEANGTLTVVPIDVQTGQPSGLPFEAQVGEVQDARSDANGGTVVGTQLQRLLSDVPSATGTMRIDVNVVPGRKPTYQRQVTCG